MVNDLSYPIICTQKFAQTVAFYEDHLDFEISYEVPQFVLLKRKTHDNVFLSIIDFDHHNIPDQYRRNVAGFILNYPVSDVMQAYKDIYWDGLDIVTKPQESNCLNTNFLIEDPNGVLINIVQDENIECETTPINGRSPVQSKQFEKENA